VDTRIRARLSAFFSRHWFSAFSFRLVYLQMIKHDEYSALAADKHVYNSHLRRSAARFSTPTTKCWRTVPGETWSQDATHVNDLEKLVPLLAETLKLPAQELSEKLQGDRRYVVVQRESRASDHDPVAAETARRRFARHLFRARRGAGLPE